VFASGAKDMTPYTQLELTDGFRSLGITSGQVVMLHASVKAVGSVMGGPNTILQALLDLLTPAGTLMMYAGWQDIPDFVLELPPDLRQRYYDHHPAFDPAIARSVRDNSVLVEFLRTWPGTQRSANPEASMVANGSMAAWLTQDHPLNYGYGAGSPLAKLVEINGCVLMLGAPLDTITLLHHAENLARLRHKQVIRYQCPILRDGQKVWVDMEDYNTGEPHDNYSFEEIALAYLAQGKGKRGTVGDAESYLFDAADLVAFAVDWLESRFGA
jgi:aminoglycoside 3-N-acetyltransferase